MKISLLANQDFRLDVAPDQKDISLFQNDSFTVIVYGYPYFCNRDSWVSATDAYELYLDKGLSMVHEIDGIYSIIVIEKSTKECKIITDRYGIYSLFYATLKNQFLISDNLEEIVAEMEELEMDKTSIIEFLNFGYKLGDKTHFKAIKKLKGALIYNINNNLEITLEKYWDLLEIDEKDKLSKADFLTIFNNHFNKATSLEEKISLPLTGGRDSRLILSACLKNKEKFHCYTHGPSYHTDVKQAKVISKHFDLPHTHYKIGKKFGKKLLEKAKSNSGFLYGHYSFFDYLHVKNSFEQESANGELFLTGILGNQLYRHHPIGNALPTDTNKSNIANLILKRVPSVFHFRTSLLDYYDNLFMDIDSSQIYKRLENSITEVLDEATAAKKPVDFTRYYMFNTYCSNCAANTLQFTGKFFKVFGAFFHKDLLKQFKFIGLNEMVGADLHNYIIGKNDKYLSELAYYNSGRVIKYLKMVSNKITNKLLGTNIFRHPDLANYHFWLRKYHKEFLVNLLDYKLMASAPLFNENGLKQILEIYLNNRIFITSKKKLFLGFSIERLMLNLISFELWLKEISKGKIIKFSD